MFRLSKAILNNLNQIKYIKNINNLELKTSSTDSTETKDMIDKEEYSLSRIISLETIDRETNLRIFTRYYSRLRLKRFVLISLPAIIGAATMAVSFLPDRYDSKGTGKVFDGNHKLYHSEFGETEYTEGYYLRGDLDTFTARHVAQSENREETKVYRSDKLYFKMYDDVNSISVDFTMSDNGELYVKKVLTKDFLDTTDYKQYDFSNMDAEFDSLVNRILEILRTSDNLSDEEKNVLNTLSKEEVKVIVTEVIKYTDLEEVELMKSKSRKPLKVFLFIDLFIYILVEICLLRSKGIGSLYEIYNEDGILRTSLYRKDLNIFYGPLKFKEEFLAAERDRINKIKEEIEKNVNIFDVNATPILTNYEKKLKQKNYNKSMKK